jgi:hypothetical protein
MAGDLPMAQVSIVEELDAFGDEAMEDMPSNSFAAMAVALGLFVMWRIHSRDYSRIWMPIVVEVSGGWQPRCWRKHYLVQFGCTKHTQSLILNSQEITIITFTLECQLFDENNGLRCRLVMCSAKH